MPMHTIMPRLHTLTFMPRHNSNFDCIFAYLTCTNYDFRCKPMPPPPRRMRVLTIAIATRRRHPEGPAPPPQHPDGYGPRDVRHAKRPHCDCPTDAAAALRSNMFAIVQKEQLGLDKAVEEVKFRM